MSNTIRIKRRALGGAAGAPGSLFNAEIAFNETDQTLYYGLGTGGAEGTSSSVLSIAGPGSFITRTTNQSVSGAKTFSGLLTISDADITSANVASLIVTGDTTVGGDLSVNGADLNSTATSFNLLATPTTLSIGSAGTSILIGASTGSTTIRNNALVSGTLGVTGAASFTADVAVNGGDITTTATTASIFGANATTITLGHDATSISMGASTGTTAVRNNAAVAGTLGVTGNVTLTGDLAVNGGDLTSSASTFNALAQSTTINIGASATALTLGATTGTTTVRNDVSITGDLSVSGGDINATTSSVNLLATPTTVNIASAGTTVVIGAATGTTRVKNNLDVDGTLNVDSTSSLKGQVDLNNNKIINLADPVNPQDATTKAYVDASRLGLDVKASVRAISLDNITTLSGLLTVDGVSLVAGNRVLLVGQTNAEDNGIYVVSATEWTRSIDADSDAKVTAGMFTFVEEGTLYADSSWVLTTNDTIALGTTELTFVQFASAGQTIAGNGLTKSGNQIDVVGTTNRISVSADAIDIASTYVGQTSITTLGTIATGTWNASTIAVNKGGTGLTSYASGDLVYASGTTTLAKLGKGTAGQFLSMNAGGAAPEWTNVIDCGTF